MGKWTALLLGALTLMVFACTVSAVGAKQATLKSSFGQLLFIQDAYHSSFLLAHDDDQVPASRNNRFRDNYNRWRDLSPDEKKQLRDRMERLKSMPPAKKERYQERSQQWEKLPAEDKNRIRESVRRWNELTPEERKEIRRRLDNR